MPRISWMLALRATTGSAVGAVGLCAATVSCSDTDQQTTDDGPVSLTMPETANSVTFGMPAPTVNVPISTGVGTIVCLSGPGTATIVDVQSVEATEDLVRTASESVPR